MATEKKTQVVLVRDRAGAVRRARIDGVEVKVESGGPAMVRDGVGVVLTIYNANVTVVTEDEDGT